VSPSRAPSSSTARRDPDALALWLVFGALSLAWGSSFLWIKIGVEEGMGPFTLVSFRLWIAVVVLAVLLRLTGGRLPTERPAVVALAVLGMINVAIPFSLITWGEQWIPSALASILNGLVPLFVIVLAAFLLHDEPITLNRLVGLVVGFAGAVLLVSPHLGAGPSADATLAFLGEVAVAVASLSYALSAVFIRRRISGRPLVRARDGEHRSATPIELGLAQSLAAAVVTSVLALLVERPAGGIVPLPPSLPAWAAVLWLGVIGSALAYVLFFRLISSWGATRTSLVTYVMPIVGIALGVTLLSERLEPAEVVGSVLVIGGLVLANSPIGPRRSRSRRPAPETPSHVLHETWYHLGHDASRRVPRVPPSPRGNGRTAHRTPSRCR
jgi:drug/metabolite transporter (DMT)-like permease